MLKENIIKLLMSKNKENAIIACALIVDNFDPFEFIKSIDNRKDTAYYTQYYKTISDRPLFIWENDMQNPFSDTTISFYYQYKEDRYILYTENAISICYDNYAGYVEIIKH